MEIKLASQKQKDLLNKKGVNYPSNLSSAEAFKLIEELFSKEKTQKSEPKAENPYFPAKPAFNNSQTMYVAYAKDIFIALNSMEVYKDVTTKDLMDVAISLVWQAKERFK